MTEDRSHGRDRMRDVEHTAPDDVDANAVWERGPQPAPAPAVSTRDADEASEDAEADR
ncbi:MAG: hypothetical protein ABEJ70_00180 [Halobacteriaceae archaeon]